MTYAYTIRNRADIDALLDVVHGKENRIEDLRNLMNQASGLMNACYTLDVDHPETALNKFIQINAAEIERLTEQKQDILGQIVLAEHRFELIESGWKAASGHQSGVGQPVVYYRD